MFLRGSFRFSPPDRMTHTRDAATSVLMLSEHVAMKVRVRDALRPVAPVEFVASEYDLQQRMHRPARLVVVHGAPPYADARLPVRLRHAVGDGAPPIIVVASSREPAWRHANEMLSAGQVDDVLWTDTERVDALLVAWTLYGAACRRKVEALRLAHASVPETLHPFMEDLLFSDPESLTVAAWAARKGDPSRFSLHRELAKKGVAPSTLVEVARMLNIVARTLVRGPAPLDARMPAVPDARAARRLLSRTLGLTPSEMTDLARRHGAEVLRERVRSAVGAMLRGASGGHAAAGDAS